MMAAFFKKYISFVCLLWCNSVCLTTPTPSHVWVKGSEGLVYQVNENALAWSDAKEKCEKKSSKLVTICNKRTSDILKRLLKGHNPSSYWTGLSEDLYNNWSWDDGCGHPVYTNWAPGQPYNEEDITGCATINGKGDWEVSHCETERKFICEKNDNGIDDDDNEVEIGTRRNEKTKRTIFGKDKKIASEDGIRNRRGVDEKKHPKSSTIFHSQKRNKQIAEKSKIKNTTEQWRDEQLDEENMALLKENLKEFSEITEIKIPNETRKPGTDTKRHTLHVVLSGQKSKITMSQGVKNQRTNTQCVFPFVYNGNTNFKCIPVRRNKNNNTRWCALSNNYDRDALWRFCPDESEGLSESQMNASMMIKAKEMKHMKEIKSIIGSVLESEGVSHNEQKKILGDLEESNKNGQTNETINNNVIGEIGTLEDEEEKLLGEEVKAQQYISDVGLNDTVANFIIRNHTTDIADDATRPSFVKDDATDQNLGASKTSEHMDPKHNERESVTIFTNDNQINNNKSQVDGESSEENKNLSPQVKRKQNELIDSKDTQPNKLIEYHILEYEKQGKTKQLSKTPSSSLSHSLPQVTAGSTNSVKDEAKISKLKNSAYSTQFVFDYLKKYAPDLPEHPLEGDSPNKKYSKASGRDSLKLANQQSHNANKIIPTLGGSGNGDHCVFPFVFDGTTYWDCIEIRNTARAWCSTSPSHSFDSMPKWGYCVLEEPKTPTDLTITMPIEKPNTVSVESLNTKIADSALKQQKTTNLQNEKPNTAPVEEEKIGKQPLNTKIADSAVEQEKTTNLQTGDFSAMQQKQTNTPSTNIENIDSPTQLQKLNDPPSVQAQWSPTSQITQHIHRKTNLHTSGEELLSTDSGLKTYAGNANGARCTIPFLFDGRTHSQCIMLDDKESWCSTTHNFDRNMKWGKCCNLQQCGENWLN